MTGEMRHDTTIRTFFARLSPHSAWRRSTGRRSKTIQAAVGECTSLIATQGEAMERATDRQLEMQQACADAVGHLAERLDTASARMRRRATRS